MLGLAEDDEAVAEGQSAVATASARCRSRVDATTSATLVSSDACARSSEIRCSSGSTRTAATGGEPGERAVDALAEAGVDIVEQPLLGLADSAR